jgi:membrane-bound lytic murein transglycosylase A|tara:strand:+ start:228 stop:1439 length:1212 start_codon:yes stop_codon:yes gene_type:complete
LKFNYLLIAPLLILIGSCGQVNIQDSCDCENPIISLEESQKCEAIPVKKKIAEYGLLKRTSWDAIKNKMEQDHLILAWPAWLRSCSVLIKKPYWENSCKSALKITNDPSNQDLIKYFHSHFNLYQAHQEDDSTEGLITGYYQPLLKGSREKSPQFKVPLYAPPTDLITVDLSELYPDLKYKRLRGRIEGNKLIPYYTREAISDKKIPLEGNEIFWVQDQVEAFFLEIQGSGVIEFEDGSRTQVGYANQNGHPYRSMGRELINKGELSRHKVSMGSIKAWAKKNKKKLKNFLNANPSYVFFRELPKGLPGPIGAMGLPISAERSVAVDRKFIPLGAPIFLSTTEPNSDVPLERLMVAQDTGGAIGGGVRADFYWGQGDKAGRKAGSMKQKGSIWVLLPKEFKLK